MKKGDRVRVKRGAKITGPFPGGEKTAGKSYVVEVFAVDKINRLVTWPGYGGYWHFTSFDNVTLVKSAPGPKGRNGREVDEVKLRVQHRPSLHRDLTAVVGG